MTTIDPNSAQAALFEKLGITKQAGTQKAAKDTLGQSDFLKLMTTQLQNQDPFAPMDNGDFIAQMAQFSTVTGIQEVNTSIGKLVEEFDQARIATASNLLGHSVLVPGSTGRPDEDGELHVHVPGEPSSYGEGRYRSSLLGLPRRVRRPERRR